MGILRTETTPASRAGGRTDLRAGPAKGIALLALVALLGACATAGQRQTKFEDSQLRYTQLVRWSEFDKAGEFVAPESLSSFLKVTQRMGGIRFIDYRIDSVEFDPDANEAVATVVYSAYKRSAPAAIAVEEAQQWRRDDETKTWRVSSTFVEKAFEAERRY